MINFKVVVVVVVVVWEKQVSVVCLLVFPIVDSN